MLAERCYSRAMKDEPKISEMTEFGKAVWLVVQDQGPYSRAALARVLGSRTGWEPSRQAISQYLNGDRGAPRELVPALVKAFDLPQETAQRLEFLYFYGQGDEPYDRWRRSRGPEKQPDDLLTEENRRKIGEVKGDWEQRDREKERDSRDTGDRAS